MADLIGQSLGRYHILEQLGKGGMATVYKAYDTNLEREVAVKVIRREAFPPEQSDQLLKRFEREAKALAKLVHPNIVAVIDYGSQDDNPYLVMEYMPGGTLKQKLGEPMPWPEAVHLLLPIARALQFAHSQGIIHRDVKPSNILLTESGDPMLTDFGIAKILEAGEATQLTATGVGIGTPDYMAPEQWTGTIGPQTDMYSLGVVLYQMVTGRLPFIADTPAAVLIKHARDPLPRPKSFVPDLPDAVEQFLIKALAKEPENRFRDMGAFARALDQLAKKQPEPETVEAEETLIDRIPEQAAATQTEAAGTPPHPHPTISWKLWGPIAAIVVLLGVGLALGPRLIQRAKPGPTPQAGLAAEVMPTDTSSPLPATVSTATPAPSELLMATSELKIAQNLLSINKRFGLDIQSDGDLVVYDNVAGMSLWSSNTKGSQADHLLMQNDGNLVLCTKDESPVWSSQTSSTQGDYYLEMQDDGDLVIYRGIPFGLDVQMWATNTGSTGHEVSIELGATNLSNGLAQVGDQSGDGRTAPANIGGKEARVTVANGAPSRYVYFLVDPAFLAPRSEHLSITIEYFDQGLGSNHWFSLDYDSAGTDIASQYKSTPLIRLTNSNQWKTATIDLPDAFFRGRENYGADFRIATPDLDLYFGTVTVTKK